MFNLSRRTILIIAIFLCCFVSAKAQEISSTKRAAIKELIVITKMSETSDMIFNLFMDNMENQITQDTIKTFSDDKSLSPKQREETISLATDFFKELFSEIKTSLNKKALFNEPYEEVVIKAYDKHFTEGEINEIVAFYKTPTGRKTIDKIPAIMMEIQNSFGNQASALIEKEVKAIVDAKLNALMEKLQEVKKPQKQPAVKKRS